MRKSQLRQQLDNHLRHDHTGSFRARKHRYFVLHKIIRDLYHIECVPCKWHALTGEHIQQLVAHWKKSKLQPSTIMKYMTVLRQFLLKIDHMIDGIDNQSLHIINRKSSPKTIKVPPHVLEQFSNPIATILFQFQTDFGLTLSEAMRLTPNIHIQQNHVWITREIATNSQDRLIPIRHEAQTQVINSLLTLCKQNQSLIVTFGYHHVRCDYSAQLKSLGLPTAKAYRYLYAKRLHQELSPTLPNYLTNQTIMREMGLQTRMTLWRYLNE